MKSAVYRFREFPETEFTLNLKQFNKLKINVKNYVIDVDFNIDILQLNLNSQQHLNNLMEADFYSRVIGVTRS